MASLSVGTGKIDITPPRGVEFNGYITGERSRGTWRNLYARAMVFDDPSRPLVLIAAELMGISDDQIAQMRKEIIRKNPHLRSRDIMICATHAHCTPVTCTNYYSETGGDRKYLRELHRQLGVVVAQALANREPVRMGVGVGGAGFNINRRLPAPSGVLFAPNPRGVCDQEVGVLRFDRLDGSPKAVLFNFTCHPTTMGGHWIHPDYPGVACAQVEEKFGSGVLAVFINGACGDIRPMVNRRTSRTFGGGTREAVLKLGTILGREVCRITKSIPTKSDTVVLKGASGEIRFPFGKPLSAAQYRAEIHKLRATIREFQKENKPRALVVEKQAELHWARSAWRTITTGKFLPWIRGEMQVFRLGNVFLVAIPGEVFCEIGLAIKRRCRPGKGFIVGFADGYVGYIPTARAIAEGGYEPDIAYRSFSTLPTKFSPQVEKAVLNTFKSLYKKVMTRGSGS